MKSLLTAYKFKPFGMKKCQRTRNQKGHDVQVPHNHTQEVSKISNAIYSSILGMSYICKTCLVYAPVFHKKLFEM